MRPQITALSAFLCLILGLTHVPAFAAGLDEPPGGADYPGVVALSHEDGEWVYKSFPDFLPLYIFDGDPPGKSNCDIVCAAVWPLVKADKDDTTVGSWTVVDREDGRRQWAYKGHPVYTFFKDTPGSPEGIGMTADWYYEKNADDFASVRKMVVVKNDGTKPVWRLLKP